MRAGVLCVSRCVMNELYRWIDGWMDVEGVELIWKKKKKRK